MIEAKEKKSLHFQKHSHLKLSTTPRAKPSKHLIIGTIVSSSHRDDQFSPGFKVLSDFPKPTPPDETVVTKFLFNNNSPVEIQTRLNRSRSADPTQRDVLDSLVRFDGDSDDIHRNTLVKVNPNVDLKLLFFDEQHPDWIE